MHELTYHFDVERVCNIEFVRMEGFTIVFQPVDAIDNDRAYAAKDEYMGHADRLMIIGWNNTLDLLGWTHYQGTRALVVALHRHRPDGCTNETSYTLRCLRKHACAES